MLDANTRTAEVHSSSFSREAARSRLPGYLADHQIISFIAQGSYGDVFLARNALTGKYRAIKVIWKWDCGEGRAYERELQAIKRFEPVSRTHPGFVHILHVGEIEEAFFYLMELADDVEKGQEIDPSRYHPRTLHRERFPPLTCVALGIALTDALSALHGNGLLHRDIKPSNIVFVSGKPKVADIGLVTDAGGTQSFVGTDGFVAPEGPTSFQADIYSLGKTLYELATGKDRHEFPALPDELGEDGLLLELNEIILRACDTVPAKRYRDADEMRKELAALEAGRSIQRLRKLERQFRQAMVAAGIVFACGILAFVLYARQKRIEREQAEERQRRFGVLLARGTEALKHGDYADALRNYIPLALGDKEAEQEHLVRLGTTLSRCVAPTNQWSSGNTAQTLSGNGSVFAAFDGHDVKVHESLSGALLWSLTAPAEHLALDFQGDVLARSTGSNLVVHSWRTGTQKARAWDSAVANIRFGGNSLCVTLANHVVVLNEKGEEKIFPFKGIPFQSFISSSGRILGTGLYEKPILLRDTGTGKPFADPPNGILTYDAAFSPDETKVLLANFDHAAVGWHLEFGIEVGYMPHQDGVTKAIFVPELELIATAGLDRVVKLWSSKTYQPLPESHVLSADDRIIDLAFVPPLSLVSVGSGGTNIVWDLSPLQQTPAESIGPLTLPSSKEISEGGANLKAAGKAVNGRVKDRAVNLSFEHEVECIALNREQTHLAVGTLDNFLTPHSVKVISIKDGRVIKELPHRDGIRFVAFSPDGTKLLAGDEDFLAILWDWEAGLPAIPPLRHGGQVSWASFSESGEWIATASADRTVRVWSATTADPITPPMKCPVRLQYVAFSEDEKSLIAANVYAAFDIPLTRVHPDSLSPLLRRYLSLDEAR